MKKVFYFILTIITLVTVTMINIFLKINSDTIHIIGININLLLNLLITILCTVVIHKVFKKANFTFSKNYRKEMKITFANSFVISSIISIIAACIIYGLQKNIMELFSLKESLINYTIFASKIWFISSPFIGLEIAVFRYYYEIEYFPIPIKILILKFLTYLGISFLFYEERKLNCFIYAKPICDIIFLLYYSRICFDITLNK